MSGPGGSSVEERIRAYLATRLSAQDLALHSVERMAVGWSHETWLFDATWSDTTGDHAQGFCLRVDPGNTLLRDLSDLHTQYRILRCLEDTPVPAPRVHFLEEDRAVLGAPFLVMEKVVGVCPNPWSRGGRAFYMDASARGVLPDSFTDALVALHALDWRKAGLEFLGVPGPGKDFARREVAKCGR